MNSSVLLPIYAKENCDYFQQALASIASQTKLPSELVVLADGPLTHELNTLIRSAARDFPCRVRHVEYPRNRGLGAVLADGLKECSYDLILRCDSDDVNVKTRFEQQFAIMEEYPDLAVYGGQIREFGEDASRPLLRRVVPCEAEEVRRCSARRNPVNHMTVALRRSSALKAGNYVPMHGYEDYYLWMRLLHCGFKILNSPEDFVLARAGGEMLSRRRGWKMARAECRFQIRLVRDGIFPWRLALQNIILRGGIRLFPPWLLALLYRRFARVPI